MYKRRRAVWPSDKGGRDWWYQ